MRQRIKIEFRKRQLQENGVDVVVQCNGSGIAEYVSGTISPNPWIDVTDYTKGLDKLSLSWDVDNSGDSEAGETNAAGSNYDKGISVDLIFNDFAYEFIYDWLLGGPCSLLNAIEVRLTDQLCDRVFRIFELKSDNLRYRPFDEPCEISTKLREADLVWHCVHKTVIFDNHQGWFEDGGSKQHPCFLTGIEPRPRIIASARMGISIFGQTVPIASAFFNENDNVFRRILNVDNFVDAPLVYTYIKNVADKCGLAVDTIFDPGQPYENLCLYYPNAAAMHTNDNSSITSPALWFHSANRWLITLADLLDKLKPVFNAEWYVTPNNTIVFQNEGFYINLTPIHDFTTGSLVMYELEYVFNGEKKPAYGRYQYQLDGSDLAAQEAMPLYNDIVDYDGDANNAMLEGSRQRVLEFAPTAFVRDGLAKEDYMRAIINEGETVAYGILVFLAIIVAALVAGVASAGAGAALAGFFAAWVISIANKADDLRDNFADEVYTGAVRLTSEQVGQPRLILWDGVAMNRAKATQIDPDDINPNTYYNPTSQAYDSVNKFQYTPVGGLFIFNYEMYYESKFTGNLYDTFYDDFDNPLKSLESHQDFSMYTDLCCEAIDIFGLDEGSFAKIGYLVKLETRNGYDMYGRIEHIAIEYENERVLLRGKVIKKLT